jgi:hypothetical protein
MLSPGAVTSFCHRYCTDAISRTTTATSYCTSAIIKNRSSAALPVTGWNNTFFPVRQKVATGTQLAYPPLHDERQGIISKRECTKATAEMHISKTRKRRALMMKKTVILWGLAFILMIPDIFSSQIVRADVEWTIIKDVDLKASPLDVAPSGDGKWLFILTPGEILIFSIPEGTITDHIPVAKEFDRIAPLLRPGVLTLTSSTKQTLQVIRFETICKIDLTGLPFKGPQEAPVTVAVFDDYQ